MKKKIVQNNHRALTDLFRDKNNLIQCVVLPHCILKSYMHEDGSKANLTVERARKTVTPYGGFTCRVPGDDYDQFGPRGILMSTKGLKQFINDCPIDKPITKKKKRKA